MTDTKNPDAGRLIISIEIPDEYADTHPDLICADFLGSWKAWNFTAALAQSQPPDDIAGWKSGKLFEDILRRRLGTASANDQTVETQHIIYGTELCALASILDQLSATKDEAMATIDRMNAEKAKPPEQAQVEAFAELDEALEFGKGMHHKLWTAHTAQILYEAARRYSELARGKT